MIEIFLCDDRKEDLERYSARLTGLAQKHRLPVRVACFETGSALCFALQDRGRAPDLIYLDILMGKENGITTGSLLRQYDYTSLLIYLTSSRDFAIPSFDTRPFYYLLKTPDDPALFERVFLSAAAEIQKGRDHVLPIKMDGSYVRVPQKDILYLEVYGHVTIVHTQKKAYRCRLPLDEAEKQLSAYRFVRVHRSYLVNPFFIHHMDAKEIVLISGDRVPLSKRYAASARQTMEQLLLQGLD